MFESRSVPVYQQQQVDGDRTEPAPAVVQGVSGEDWSRPPVDMGAAESVRWIC